MSTSEQALGRFLVHLRDVEGRPANTVAAYHRDVRRYLAHVGDAPLETMTPTTVAAFLDAVDLAPSSVARLAAAVRRFHRFCADHGITSADPTTTLSGPRVDRPAPATLSLAEVARLLAAVEPAGPRGPRDRGLLEVVYGGRLRISDAVGLDVADVAHTAAGAVLVVGAARNRHASLSSSTAGVLEEYLTNFRPRLAAAGEPAVFVNARGRRLSRQSGWKIISTACRRAGLPSGLGPDVLRHSAERHLAAMGVERGREPARHELDALFLRTHRTP